MKRSEMRGWEPPDFAVAPSGLRHDRGGILMSMRHRAAPRSLPAVSEVEAFLVHEAALLDTWDLAAWLDLFTADAIYWLPTSRDQASGHEQVSHIYDDRRLLETRGRRAQHALVPAQQPPAPAGHP